MSRSLRCFGVASIIFLAGAGAILSPLRAEPPSGVAGSGPELTSRPVRWTLIFDTKDGNAYAEQLRSLGAILGVPGKDTEPYRLISDLSKRPAVVVGPGGKMEQQFTWVDADEESVARLAKALQLEQVPRYFVTFIPRKLEEELLRKELAFGGRKAEDISETRFKVVPSGKG